MFFFKKKPIVVDCFTHRQSIFEFSKIDNAIKFVPTWWKKLESVNYSNPINPMSSMKKCAGFIDLYKSGFIVPMWSDFAISIKQNGEYVYQYSDKVSEAVAHPTWQHNNYFPSDKHCHLKLINPWLLREKSGVKWHLSHCVWNVKPYDFTVVSGILDFKYQMSLNANIFFQYQGELTNCIISHGTPLIHSIPMSDKKVILKHHVVGIEEYNKILDLQSPIVFTDKLKKIKSYINKNDS